MESCKMEKKEKIPRLRESGVQRHRAGCNASSRLAWEMVGSPAPLALGGVGGEEKVANPGHGVSCMWCLGLQSTL